MADGAPARIHRLGEDDVELARSTFALMAEVFEHPSGPLPATYVARLLDRPDMWAYAAVGGDGPIGGLTAHVLPMTSLEASEVFLYDLAVAPDHQRHGIGRALVKRLIADAEAAGIDTVWVPADDEDEHALDFYRALGGRPSPVTVFDLGAR